MTEHILECAVCHGREYVDKIPSGVWVCPHYRPEPGKKFSICGSCSAISWVDQLEFAPSCKRCDENRQKQQSIQVLEVIRPGAEPQQQIHTYTPAEINQLVKKLEGKKP